MKRMKSYQLQSKKYCRQTKILKMTYLPDGSKKDLSGIFLTESSCEAAVRLRASGEADWEYPFG